MLRRIIFSLALICITGFAGFGQTPVIRDFVGMISQSFHPDVVTYMEKFQAHLQKEGYSSEAKSVENYLDFPRALKKKTRDNYIFTCTDCGESFSWSDFRRSHSRRQMNIGGAGDAFRRFINQYERNLDDNKLMLEVDRLIHEFHYGLRIDGITKSPGRIAAANLIDSDSMTETIKFLDDLSNSVVDDEMEKNAQIWREHINKYN